MTLDELLTAAARSSWRRRSLWVLGLLATSGGLLVNLIVRAVAWSSAAELSRDNLDLQQSLVSFMSPGVLIASVTGAFVLGLASWLVSAVAEGSLIVAVKGRAAEGSSSLAKALRDGLGLLGRFVGIDTLLFLPLFLLALALMLVGFGGLAGLVLVATRPGAQLLDLLLVMGISTLISVPILLLMLLTGAVIFVLRSLAFRAAAMEDMNAADSIRRAWRLLRRHVLSVSILALVLWAIRSLVGTPLRLLTMLVVGSGWAMAWTSAPAGDGGAGILLAFSGLILALLTWLVNGIMNVYGSTSWTLSYETWATKTARTGNEPTVREHEGAVNHG